jgi:hypothetical protein
MNMDDFNKSYAIVLVGGKAAIMKFKDDGGFELLSKESFMLYLGADAARGKTWLVDESRQCFDGIVFEPGKATPGYYNLWQGFPIQPLKGSCQKFLSHIRENVCAGNEAQFKWFMGWWASIIQQPAQKLESCICVVGEEGTGKTFIAEVFKKLFGRYAITVSKSEHIFGQFNSHMNSLLLLHADEAFWSDDKKAEGRIKDMITGKTHQIERKFFDLITVSNYMNLFVTSNEERPVPAGLDARRFAIWKISDAHKRDNPYFAAIQAELDSGGYAALMEHLLAYDLSGINLREIPKTEALLTAKMEGLDDKHNWLLDILSAGRLPNDMATNLSANECPASMLFESYIAHAGKTSPRRKKSIQTQLGMWLKKAIPGLRPSTVNVAMAMEYESVKQMRVWTFPPLRECRAAFLKLMNQETTLGFWNDDLHDWNQAKQQTPAKPVFGEFKKNGKSLLDDEVVKNFMDERKEKVH